MYFYDPIDNVAYTTSLGLILIFKISQVAKYFLSVN